MDSLSSVSLSPSRFDFRPGAREQRPVRQLLLVGCRVGPGRRKRIAIRRFHAEQVVDEVVPLLVVAVIRQPSASPDAVFAPGEHEEIEGLGCFGHVENCLLYTSPSPRDS